MRADINDSDGTHQNDILAVMTEVTTLAKQGRRAEAGERLDYLLRRHSRDYMAHIFASAFFSGSGNTLLAMAEAATALALDPSNAVAYRRMGLLMRRIGRHKASELILERGWALMSKMLPKRAHGEERERFFADHEG